MTQLLRPTVELRHLWYFVAVADELSFSRAAQRVGIAQPPLSQQIQRLEDSLGARLFDRSARRVQLTEAGKLLVPEARRLLADAAHTAQRVRSAGRGEIGALTIGYWASTLFSPLPVAVRRFRERFTGVAVRLRELYPPDHIDAIRTGAVDIAILREPEPVDGIAELPVLVEPLVAALPADHRLARRRTIAPGLLRDEPFVLFPREAVPGLHDRLLGLCRGAGFEPRIIQEVEAWHTIVSLVEAGIGVSLIPASFEGRRTGALVYRPLSGPQVQTTTSACWRAAGTSRAAEAFLDVLRGEAARITVRRPARTRSGQLSSDGE
ncbi:MAG TPA: LysR family transcriptional regulator [Kofleriaceae bacterium]|nr:LysR family transcriptional regulator [Kofleriaceae bacterium]